MTTANDIQRKTRNNGKSTIENMVNHFISNMEGMIVRKTQSERRAALFGRDPLAKS